MAWARLSRRPARTRYQQIADDYAEVTQARKHGGGFKTALVVSPTHKEAETGH